MLNDKFVDYLTTEPLFGPYSIWLAELCKITKGTHVLDVGYGIGVSAFPLLDIIGPKGKIAGVDISLHLISQALKRAEYLQVPNASFSATWQEILDEFNEKLTKDQYLHLTISAHGFVLRKPFM